MGANRVIRSNVEEAALTGKRGVKACEPAALESDHMSGTSRLELAVNQAARRTRRTQSSATVVQLSVN